MVPTSPLMRQDALAIAGATASACRAHKEPFEPMERAFKAFRIAMSSSAMLARPTSGQADTEIQNPVPCTTVAQDI